MGEKKNVIRRLYDWVLSWAESPYGTWALFLISFAESSFFPIPPDPLLLALCLGNRKRALWYAFICSLGSVLGGIFGYALGLTVWESIQDFFYDWIPGFTPEMESRFRAEYEAKGFLIVFMAGFSPIPYKIVTILSGAMKMNFPLFVIASVIGRSARFFIEGVLVWKFGEPISAFIDKYFDRLALLFVILLIGGFAVMKLIL